MSIVLAVLAAIAAVLVPSPALADFHAFVVDHGPEGVAMCVI